MKYTVLLGVALLGAPTYIFSADEQPTVGEVDIQQKKTDAIQLVNEAVSFFKKNSIARCCNAFQNDLRWVKGEMRPFIFDEAGVCYIAGEKGAYAWRDFSSVMTGLNEPLIKSMITTGQKGGWISFRWNNGLRYCYVRTVMKKNKAFVLGTGFFPESPEYSIQNMVKEAVAYMERKGLKETVERINNPIGYFVRGDLYLWMYDVQGNMLANGGHYALVGQNVWDWKDEDGEYMNRRMITEASEKGEVWINYKERNTDKRAYIERVIDPLTKKVYVIGGGYYVDQGTDQLLAFVAKAINHLKAEGADKAFQDFSRRTGDFYHANLSVFVYDLEGTVLADGENPEFIGQNMKKLKDIDGKPVVKLILEEAQKNGQGYVSFVDKGSYKIVYVKLVDVPDGKFIIGGGYWPLSKPYDVRFFVEKASSYLAQNSVHDACALFASNSPDYLRGDLCIAVHTNEGICLADGLDKTRIWNNDTLTKDARGYNLTEKMIALANRGGGWMDYKANNGIRRMYVEQVVKDGDDTPFYVVSAGYYL